MKNSILICLFFFVCFLLFSCGETIQPLPISATQTNEPQEPTKKPKPVSTETLSPTITPNMKTNVTPTITMDSTAQLMAMQQLIEQNMREPDLAEIQYGAYQNSPLLLDIYLPHQGDRPYPVVIVIHGGGWDMWNKRMFEPWYYQFLDQGYALASIEYTLSDLAKWPEQGRQVNAGVRWLRANAVELGLDPEKFVVVGGSAGGHLAGIVGVTSDLREFNSPEYGNTNVTSRVSGVITYYAAFDLVKAANHPSSKGSKLLGCPSEECLTLAENASVNLHVTPDDPPFYMLHGTGDTVVSKKHSEIMLEALQQSNVEATLVILEGYVHGDERFGKPEIMSGVLEFVQQVFSK